MYDVASYVYLILLVSNVKIVIFIKIHNVRWYAVVQHSFVIWC